MEIHFEGMTEIELIEKARKLNDEILELRCRQQILMSAEEKVSSKLNELREDLSNIISRLAELK